ncbi:ankyrin repeat and SOCS box protein 10-like isoform X1 [Rana temporaria]|uniref:ankyrin repeat and SOCS box protein 10-like isoform X1 n=1 Tax=Rana temporaria TaxID=8407 RepID=UPI001AAC6945|nr:ankyrin repeat and SOCS box protein 10-like isoform X1 [Rana temporaria]
MSLSFPFSSGALRSLQLEAEEQERWEKRKKLSRVARRPSVNARRLVKAPPQLTSVCTDPLFHQAIFTGDLATLQVYMEAKASANVLVPSRNHDLRWNCQQAGIWSLTYEEEYTCPLYVTASRGYSDCLQLLLKKGAEVDFSPSGESALHGACQNGHSECVRLLLRHGANPNMESQNGTFPLHHCQKPESYHCAKLLLQYGAHVNRQTEDEEFTPLHVAAQHGLLEHVDLYLRHGAAVDKRSINGETPLSVACSHPQGPQDLDRYFQVCQNLIQHGADILSRDKDQQNPLHLACKSANPQVVELLLEKGAEVNTMSYSGNTAMQNILQVTSYKLQNQPELIVRALLNHGAVRVWPGSLIKVLRYCYTSPRTVEVLLNTYSKLRGTEDWAEVVPEEEQQKHLQFFQSVFSLSRSPRSLQHLCRCALRSHLEGRMPRVLPKLPLPPPILQFLQLHFEDILY